MKKFKVPENLGSVLLTIWVVFSVVYVAYDAWGDFKVSQLNQMQAQAYQAGYTASVQQLMVEAAKCEGPVEVFSGEAKLTLLNPACDSAAAADTSAQ